MKLRKITLILLLIVLLTTACGTKETPTEAAPTAVQPTEVPPTAAPAPTATLATVQDPVWDRIKTSGKIVFGTSADYNPFEYYDSSYQIVGFDPAIALELGKRLGVQVELKDIPFESLGSSLQIGQIDAAIAAISVTTERQAYVDFTNIYYTSQDSMLARQGSGIGTITTPVQLAQYRVGVQRGTTYQAWMQKNLVDTGLMPAANLLAYEKPEHAVRDLKENWNDVVVMGTAPAQDYLKSGGLEIVGQSINSQFYAIALPKGSRELQSWMNDTLSQMATDGTLNKFAQEYLHIDISQIPPVTTPTPFPTAVVPPTPAPVACYDAMAFVEDMTVPDGTEMSPGQEFDKIWRLQNIGTCTWNSTYWLVFVQGDRMDGNNEVVDYSVPPGQTYDMTIDQTAPDSPGSYQGVWQMVNGKNVPFGERVYVEITVPGPPPATSIPPTETPVPPIQPTLPPAPVIDSFTVEPTSVTVGGMVVVNWSFHGQDLASARLTRTDPDGAVIQLNGGSDVSNPGTYEDLAMIPGTVIYTLVVSSETGGATTATVSVTVNP
jgi:ABC-type amino acid transport substrate-binding protein